MPIQDNSPTKGFIRWHDIDILYEGFVYNIKDGYTDKKYVYWRSDDPYKFYTGDIIPYTQTEIVFMNSGGVTTVYPLTKIQFTDSLNKNNVNSTMLLEHISNSGVHFTGMDKDLLYILSEKLDMLDGKVSKDGVVTDGRLIALENEIPSIIKRLEIIEKKLGL